MNSTMDWLEFAAFLQDFGIVPKLANRIYCERVFITFSSTKFEWHDREGHVTKETEDETHLEALKFEGFKHCLGFLSMVLFDKDYIRSQCPTPNSKLELLFFKAKRPKWLLHASEKRLTSKVDSAVRATVMRDVHNSRLKKFIGPKSQIEDFKGLLSDMASNDAEVSLFK